MDKRSAVLMYNISAENLKQWRDFIVSKFGSRIHKYFLLLFEYTRDKCLKDVKKMQKMDESQKQDMVYAQFKHNCIKLQDWSIKNFEREVAFYDEEIPNLERVLTLLFQLNFMVLSMNRLNQNTRFKAPKADKQKFVKDCYLSCACQVCFNKPHLFDQSTDMVKQSEYFQTANTEIRDIIKSTIFTTVPIDLLTDKKKATKEGSKDQEETNTRDPKEIELEARFKKEQIKSLGFALEDLQKKKKVSHGYRKKIQSEEEIAKERKPNLAKTSSFAEKLSSISKTDKEYKQNVEEWMEQTESVLQGMTEEKPAETKQEDAIVRQPSSLVVPFTTQVTNRILPPTKENLRMLDIINQQQQTQEKPDVQEKQKSSETKPLTVAPIKKVPSQERPSVLDKILEQVTPTREKQKPSPGKPSRPVPKRSNAPEKPSLTPDKTSNKQKSTTLPKPNPIVPKKVAQPTKEEDTAEEEGSDHDDNSVIVESNVVSRKASTNYEESQITKDTQGEEDQESDGTYSEEANSESDLGVDVEV